jgi:hypothetical protein
MKPCSLLIERSAKDEYKDATIASCCSLSEEYSTFDKYPHIKLEATNWFQKSHHISPRIPTSVFQIVIIWTDIFHNWYQGHEECPTAAEKE